MHEKKRRFVKTEEKNPALCLESTAHTCDDFQVVKWGRVSVTSFTVFSIMSTAEKKPAEKKEAGPAPAEKEESGMRSFEVLEEDDDFEEFAQPDWNEKDEVGDDKHDWDENWDDEQPSDNFLRQLREELSRADAGEQQMQA